MIPSIEEIIEGMEVGRYSREQGIAWLHQHSTGSIPLADEDRLLIASMAMEGICAASTGWPSPDDGETIALRAVAIADALIAELQRTAQGRS